jgi:hypothetical protein
VGCENYVPVSGYPYNAILGDLNQNPAMSELQFAQIIVRDYVEFYKPRAHFNGGVMGTLSAIDLLKIEKVVEDLSEFTKVLMRDMDAAREMIDDARDDGMLPWSEYGWDRYIDLPTFVLNVTLTTDDSAIKLAGDVLQSSLAEAIVALGNTESMESEGARGMGIWFPSSHHSVWGLTTYTETKFAAQGWLDFLYSCWNDYHP